MVPLGPEVHVAAGTLVSCSDGEVRILLGRRSSRRRTWPGVWDFPGGHIEPGETTVGALVRELREELGVYTGACHEVASLPVCEPNSGQTVVLHLYAVTEWQGTPKNCEPEENDEIAWFTLPSIGLCG